MTNPRRLLEDDRLAEGALLVIAELADWLRPGSSARSVDWHARERAAIARALRFDDQGTYPADWRERIVIRRALQLDDGPE